SNAVPVTVGPDQEIQMQLVVYVTQVLEGTPAAEAGLESGDQILAVGNRLAGSFDSGDAFSAHLAKLKPGTKTTLAVSRGNAMVSLTVTIGHRLIDAPEPYRSQWLKQAEGQFWADQSNRPGKDR
ncbi:MAG: PDZ domain-containing protein, partial [Planctomycetota bacterium]